MPEPLISAVLVTADGFASIRRVVAHLRVQTVRDRLELVVVAPDAAALQDASAPELEGFSRVRPVHVGRIDDLERPIAAGVRAATAPVVAPIEDHAFPEPDWGEHMIEAHRGPWAGVGPAVLNGNPDALLSWSNMLLSYGRWPAQGPPRETRDIARHNSTFKRDVLLSYSERLESLLTRSGGLLPALLADGHRLYFEPRARIHHLNPSTLSSTIDLRVKAGRLYGATRASNGRWSPVRRLLYSLGAPLIPPFRLMTQRKFLFAGRRGLEAVSLLPALFVGLGLDAVGQVMGYVRGEGDTRDEIARFEFGRLRHLNKRDRARLAS